MNELVGFGINQMLALNIVTGAGMALVVYIIVCFMLKKMEQQRKDDNDDRIAERAERERQAKEHMEKWNSMVIQNQNETDRLTREHRQNLDHIVKGHQQDTDRMFRLLERETQVNELHANLLQTINAKLDKTTICPLKK